MKRSILFVYLTLLSILLSIDRLSAEEWFKVKWVNDGDTIVLMDGRQIRYIGINAPEIKHSEPVQKAQPYGYTASNFNKKLVFTKMVHLEFDKERYDQYGRLLAYVFLTDGTFVNAKMLEKGYAYYLPRKPNSKYNEVLLQSQRRAMVAKNGIWSTWKEKKVRYLGNIRSQRFHISECPFGKKTGEKNRVFFSRKWDAFWAGFAPCTKCLDMDYYPLIPEP